MMSLSTLLGQFEDGRRVVNVVIPPSVGSPSESFRQPTMPRMSRPRDVTRESFEDKAEKNMGMVIGLCGKSNPQIELEALGFRLRLTYANRQRTGTNRPTEYVLMALTQLYNRTRLSYHISTILNIPASTGH